MTYRRRFLCWLLGHRAKFYHPQQEGTVCRRCLHMIFRDGSESLAPWPLEYRLNGEQSTGRDK